MAKKSCKLCFVEECVNSTLTTPNKKFVSVPRNHARRKLWFDAVGCDIDNYSPKTTLYCCEDHFDLPNDAENWIQHTLMKCRIRLKQCIVPHIFNFKRIANATDPSADTFEHQRTPEFSNQMRTNLVSILRKSALKRQGKEITNEIVPSSSSIVSCDVKNDVVPHNCECQSGRKRAEPVPVLRIDDLKRQQIEITTDNTLPSSSCIVSDEDNNLFLVVFTPIKSIYSQECKKMKIGEASTSNSGIEFVDVNSVDNTSELLDNSTPNDDKSNVVDESVNIKTEYDPDNIQDHNYVTDECGQEFIVKPELDIKEEMLDD